MSGATPATLALAATCVALTWLLAEQGLQRCTALRRIAASPRGLARLLIGAVLLGTMAAAATSTVLPANTYHGIAGLPGYIVAALACAVVLQHRHRPDLRAALPWLLAMLAPLFVAQAGIAQNTQHWLIGGFALAFALGAGLPAFAALAQRLDDSDTPAFMRPLPARVLAAGVAALALAGSASW